MLMCFGMKLIQECIRGHPDQTNLKVTCGKPIYVVSFKTIKIITVATILFSVITIFDCMQIFINAIKIKLTIGILINMISKNEGNFLPTVFVVPALLCIFLNAGILYFIYLSHAQDQRPYTNLMMYIMVLVCLLVEKIIIVICIIILAHVYAANEQLHNGIIDAMRNYATQSDIKLQIDMMQIEYQCCGSKKYDEWYDIQWYDANMVKAG